MTREIAHQKSFEKALYAIEPNFPPGKLPGHPDFTDKYFNMSQGEGDAEGPWNTGSQWEKIDEREAQMAVVAAMEPPASSWTPTMSRFLEVLAARTQSDPTANPVTGVDLGAGPGAGKITELET